MRTPARETRGTPGSQKELNVGFLPIINRDSESLPIMVKC